MFKDGAVDISKYSQGAIFMAGNWYILGHSKDELTKNWSRKSRVIGELVIPYRSAIEKDGKLSLK